MAHFSQCALPCANLIPTPPLFPSKTSTTFFTTTTTIKRIKRIKRRSLQIRTSSNTEDSYLGLWKNAVDQERKEIRFQRITENSVNEEGGEGGGETDAKEDNAKLEEFEKKNEKFHQLLDVPKEVRDRVHRKQLIDRASAAIEAARSLIKESPRVKPVVNLELSNVDGSEEIGNNGGVQKEGTVGEDGAVDRGVFVSESGTLERETPGPDFWSWTPPLQIDTTPKDANLQTSPNLQTSEKPASSPDSINSVMEKERNIDVLSIPFQSIKSDNETPPLPPLQSFMEVEKVDPFTEQQTPSPQPELDLMYLENAAEAAEALHQVEEVPSEGVNPDGSKYWNETGVEQRADGVVCHWTLTRGVSADGSVEWENKFWEAAGQFDYKELGSQKSGRDAFGNVWREYWKESMWQDQASGLTHIEKTADKWGKNGVGGQWQEKWWEHYDASGQAEKWAHKTSSINPDTPVEAGHAHVWNERWGEKYDGKGGSVKYTDKWAENFSGDGWTKWGDKWDENFNEYGHGVKQGESWWQGKYGEQWNRTWGEQHKGSGWVHKYGKSSSGEHWDTHVQQDTWYERHPHFGFEHCLENSKQLREVRAPSETP